VEHVDSLESEVLEGGPHRPRHHRGDRSLDFEPQSPIAPDDDQIDLGAGRLNPSLADIVLSSTDM
jgi:hypothetical protein